MHNSKRDASSVSNNGRPVSKVTTTRSSDFKIMNNSRGNSPGGITNHYQQLDESMTEDHANLLSKISFLENDLKRRQESYVSRERSYKLHIDELEEELSNQKREKTGWMKTDKKMALLKNMQGQIIKNVELVQDRTAKILQEQERDLLRAFRARLFDVQTELEKEKSKKDDGAGAWIERSRQLEAEVEWAKEVADKLERVNQTLLQENARLKSQFQSQEEDRNFLIKQLVAVKKDNARLRAEYTAAEADSEVLKQQLETAQQLGGAGAGSAKTLHKSESEDKFKEVNGRLRRMLAEEKKSLSTVRQNYANELKARTETELLLRQAVEDVRREIARRHMENAQAGVGSSDLAQLYLKNPGMVPLEGFTQQDRERTLELLLSQERVVTLLYAKTFPVASDKRAKGGVLNGDFAAGDDEEDQMQSTQPAVLLEVDRTAAQPSPRSDGYNKLSLPPLTAPNTGHSRH